VTAMRAPPGARVSTTWAKSGPLPWFPGMNPHTS
jgi:hypothetical protein